MGRGGGRGDTDDALADAVYADEVFEAAAGLVEVEEVFEGFFALEVELGVVHPDVGAGF